MDGEQKRLAGLRPRLELRSQLYAAVRRFFVERDYLEVQTPIRIVAPAMEEHIDVEPAGDAWLRTSPELHMKRMLCAGYERIFQIGPCFRKGESGRLHEPEFTMLEWYRSGGDYHGILCETRELLAYCAETIPSLEKDPWWAGEWETVQVAEAFERAAGWNPVTLNPLDHLKFDLDLVEKVEPSLPSDRPVALIDYPAEMAAMARIRGDVAERWELYLGGIEIANAYTELTDAEEQRKRFETWKAGRLAVQKPVYPLDEAFLSALEAGMPSAGGAALGLDRLLLIMAGEESLEKFLPFRGGK
jgi:lysyl-tRNA synthetase class 2